MYMKRLLLVNCFACALLGASVVFAQPATEKVNAPLQKAGQCRQHVAKMLTPEQRTELQQIRKDMRVQLLPLIKEKRVLKLQIMGKIATPNVQWSEVASLVDKNNANNAKIAMLVAKTRFETYHKLGILMPLRHHHCHHFKNFAKK
ncbi:periplasmic heavy metal sensor [Legionella drancourtii]|uniref:Signaling pathway modulator ZraP n=1 Tax=Legionella drancourtii LLAP12 TaxID=658187 RepID=G9ET71_9GAMM|nr:periplasmic heavy metal sensor [Legionella drancourtii]EHL29538.1 hypothetical protein LDG_8500 [Legionella drancourtii LLAP12]